MDQRTFTRRKNDFVINDSVENLTPLSVCYLSQTPATWAQMDS